MEKVNINTASVDELQKIIHIGPVRARKIKEIQARDKFKSWDEIRFILGIGEIRIKDILNQDLIIV